MKIKKVDPEIISLENYEPTRHSSVFLNLQKNTICIVRKDIAVEIYLSR
jgi:hypothetical protein